MLLPEGDRITDVRISTGVAGPADQTNNSDIPKERTSRDPPELQKLQQAAKNKLELAAAVLND
eukprot:9742687-Alexandrium_andersonii.AAC.1